MSVLKRLKNDLFDFVGRIMRHDVWGMAGQTAFFLMLAIFPLLLFLVSVLNQANFSLSYESLCLFLPANIANLVVQIGKMAPTEGNWPMWSVLMSLWAASAGVWALMRGVHRAYRQRGIERPIRARLLSLAFTFGFAVAIALSLALNVFSRNVTNYITYQLGTGSFVMETPIRRLIMLGFIFLFLTLLYWLTPGVGGRISKHMVGAAVAAGLWLAASALYEAYMTRYDRFSSDLYGSIGAFLGFLLWLFILCIIVLFGAEINAFLRDRAARKHGTAVEDKTQSSIPQP